MTMCRNRLPAARPSFKQIITYLNGMGQENPEPARVWPTEVDEQLANLSMVTRPMTSEPTGEASHRRATKESGKVARDLAKSQQRARNAYIRCQELTARFIVVTEEERVAAERERRLHSVHRCSSASSDGEERTASSVSNAREKSKPSTKEATVKSRTYPSVRQNRLRKKPRVRGQFLRLSQIKRDGHRKTLFFRFSAVKSLIVSSSAATVKNPNGSDATKIRRCNKSFGQRSTSTKDNRSASSHVYIVQPEESTSDTESEFDVLEAPANANGITTWQISSDSPRVESHTQPSINNGSDTNSIDFRIDDTEMENGEHASVQRNQMRK